MEEELCKAGRMNGVGRPQGVRIQGVAPSFQETQREDSVLQTLLMLSSLREKALWSCLLQTGLYDSLSLSETLAPLNSSLGS